MRIVRPPSVGRKATEWPNGYARTISSSSIAEARWFTRPGPKSPRAFSFLLAGALYLLACLGNPHDMNAAMRVRGDAGGDGSPPCQRVLPGTRGTEHDEIDIVAARELEQSTRRMQRLDDVQRKPG